MNDAALSFLYQYIGGGFLFSLGLYFGWRGGYVGLRSPAQRMNLFLCLGGLALLFVLQGYLQFVAPNEPQSVTRVSEPLAKKSVGTSLDYGVMIAYFLVILAIGTWFGRNSKSTKDFFFGGQRFSWWFITMSLVATVIGSYSFVKYSKIAYNYGLSSSQSYLNDWFWIPLFLFGWLPIIFFSKVVSIPEYFDRRFGRTARLNVTFLLLVYLVGYVGINLYTMGTALEYLLSWDVFTAACVVAAISAVYVTVGGQTSVIVTDLFQGIMQIAAGILIMVLGVAAFGGFGDFWSALPPEHRMAFPNFNDDPSFSLVGVFWQDAVANTAVFYFLNQGCIMRFMSVKNVTEGRKAIVATVLILMPLASIVVASGGWIGSAMNEAGMLPPETTAKHIFFTVSQILCSPGIFGLVMAALTAALMSTVDTLITAVAAIAVNDIWRPYIKPNQPDAYYLKVARYTSITVTLVGVALVPVFSQFDSIYSAHGAFTAAVTPPLVIALLLAVLWPRYTPAAASATILGGFAIILLSVQFPSLIEPFAHGVPTVTGDGTELVGAKAHKFMRAFFGLSVSLLIGILVSLFTKPRAREEIEGLTQASSQALVRARYGAEVNVYDEQAKITITLQADTEDAIDLATGSYVVHLSAKAASELGVRPGDTVLLSDSRWWFGGLRSVHAQIHETPIEEDGICVKLGPTLRQRVDARGTGQLVAERIL